MVHLHSLGLGVTVHSQGAELTEYDDPHESPAADHAFVVATRYIEAVSDAEFYIQYNFSDPTRYPQIWNGPAAAIAFTVFVDGIEVDQTFYRRGHLTEPELLRIRGQRHHTIKGQQMVKNFRFAAISLVDDDSVARVDRDKEIAGSLGVLEIRAFRVQWPSQRESGIAAQGLYQTGQDEQLEFAEKAVLKATKGTALSHRTKYSNPTPGVYRGTVDSFKREEHPFAIFKFKYRSRAGLRQELILPRSSTEPEGPDRKDAKAWCTPDDVRSKLEPGVKKERKKTALRLESGTCFDLTQGDEVVELPRGSLTLKQEAEVVIDLTAD